MYDVIDMKSLYPITEQFSVGKDLPSQVDYFSEAVFQDGKKTVEPLLKCFEACRNLLLDEIKAVEDSEKANKNDSQIKVKQFNPKAYWKNKVWKDLEDQVVKIFGFRYCEINPYQEKYISKEKMFESRELNCMVGHPDRFPIEGLVTDKGFYDKSHSSVMYIYVSLGLLKDLEPDEILAVFLHEFGHSIDPALTTITYAKTNILSKYLTDRKGSLTKAEKKLFKENKLSETAIFLFFFLGLWALLYGWATGLFDIIFGKKKDKNKGISEESAMKKIRAAIKKDKELFDRKNFSEAFADNFARMYGYGAVIMRSLHKLSKHNEEIINNWTKKEKMRQAMIVEMTMNALKDVHRTDIHRIHSLIREYKNDIEDPNTPPMIKKALQEDLDELVKVLDMYTNNFSEFQNKINKAIDEELTKMESAGSESDDKDSKEEQKEEAVKESTDVENFDEYTIYYTVYSYTWSLPAHIIGSYLDENDDLKKLNKMIKSARRDMNKAVNKKIREVNKSKGLFSKLPLMNLWFTADKNALFPGLSIKKALKNRKEGKDINIDVILYTETGIPLSTTNKSDLVDAFTEAVMEEIAGTEWLSSDNTSTFKLINSGKPGKNHEKFIDQNNKIFDLVEN